MPPRQFDIRTFLLIFGAACVGAAWATYNRGTTSFPYDENQIRALIWVVFAAPFAMFWGWFFARPRERWLAAFVCFCIYFFAPFVAARYETCTVVYGSFNLVSCFADTEQAQQLAGAIGHRIYFESVVVIQLLAALGTALQRALSRSTMPSPAPRTEAEPA
jgi:cation transport ATPase